STARAMCLEELLALKDRHLDRLSLHFLMSREPQEVALYNGRLDDEHVRQLASSFFAPAEVAEYFVCGPGDMIDSVSQTLRALGVGSERIRAEHFTVATTAGEAATPANSAAVRSGERPETSAGGAPAAVTADADMAEVTVIMDGRRRSFTMRMNAESVLDGAAKAGLELPFSCRAGVCSTCRTKVLQGEVAMTQNYALEDWELEQGYVLACQSKVKTPVLELDYDER
ncbi:MAG TPA: 2Fe-2S iron-sulfur cluster-binding protein, partial [Steroidobacteraceae bacterium]|nr:2Fe-2S iron-sulfur cluster-binding protein [Steroidobacteraceae bacterium]